MEGTYLLAMRGPAFRRHDSYPGFRTELENRVGDAKGKSTSGDPTRPKVPTHRSGAHCFVRAIKRSNVRGAKGAGHPRQDGVNGQPEELLVLAEAGRLPRGGTSRMTRESHVRICGRLGVKFPGPTRRGGLSEEKSRPVNSYANQSAADSWELRRKLSPSKFRRVYSDAIPVTFVHT
jgi:hypothetical protein